MTPPETMDFEEVPEAPRTKPVPRAAPTVAPKRVASNTPPPPAHPLSDRSAEAHVLACCFLDQGPTLDRAIASLSPQDFFYPEHAIIFRQLASLRADGKPITTETLVAERAAALAGVNPMLLVELTDPSKYPTTAHAGYMISRVRELADRREIQRKAKATLEAIEAGVEMDSLPVIFQRPAPPTQGVAARPLFDFSIVSDGDKSILLGDRYLNRGDGAVIVSTSGMGKSALTIQMATELALGLSPFGIKGNGPLTSLVVQAEDSDGDVAEVAHSMKHVLGLTPEQIATVNSRVIIVTERVNRGTRFLTALKALVALHKPDLVWINPLQAFMDGDVTDGQDLGAFLREGLNGLNQPAQFGYIVVHHTTKPATGKDRAERLWHEVMYDMAGGAEIINWARAIMSLRAAEQEGDFNLVLAKRGRRAGVTRKVPLGTGFILEPVTVIPLRHATGRIAIAGTANGIPKIHWESREPDAPKEKRSGTGAGPAIKFPYENYRSVFPKKTDPGKPFNEILRACDANGAIPKGSLQGVLKRWEEECVIEVIRPETGAMRYRSAL